LVGYSNQNPIINREEVESYKWQYISDIKIDVQNNPQNYASWFKIALDKVF
jgi:isopentenyl-diphosphate delta-isomerase